MTTDGPRRRVHRVPGARLAGLVAVLGLVVAVLALPSVHTAFSARSGTPVNSLAADQLRPPSALAVTQTCSYSPVVLRGALASTRVASAPVALAAGATGTGSTATTPALTTTATGAVVVHLLTRSGGQPPSPTGTTALWTHSSDSETVTAADEAFAGPGAVPQRTSTTAGSTTAWIAQTVVLRPALEQVGATLTWTATPSSWADGYRGERVVGGTVQASRTVPIGTTTVGDPGLANGTTYTYRVRAYRGSWVSTVQTTTLTPSC
jgi:hypothetical protein